MHDIFDGMPQESASHLLELFRRVRGKELKSRCGLLLRTRKRGRSDLQLPRNVMCCGFRRIDDRYVSRRDPAEQRLNERIVRAAEDKNIGVGYLSGECFVQINSRDLLGDRILDPSFLDQRHKERTGFFVDHNAACFERMAIRMACNGRVGPDYHNFTGAAGLGCGARSGLDDTDDLDIRCRFDFVKCQRGCRVAGNDQQFRSLRFQMADGANRIVNYCGCGLGPVGKASRVAEIQIVGVGNMPQERGENC